MTRSPHEMGSSDDDLVPSPDEAAAAADRAGDRAGWLALMCLALIHPLAADATSAVLEQIDAVIERDEPLDDSHPTTLRVAEELSEWMAREALLAIAFHTTLPALLFGRFLADVTGALLTPDEQSTAAAQLAAMDDDSRKAYIEADKRAHRAALDHKDAQLEFATSRLAQAYRDEAEARQLLDHVMRLERIAAQADRRPGPEPTVDELVDQARARAALKADTWTPPPGLGEVPTLRSLPDPAAQQAAHEIRQQRFGTRREQSGPSGDREF